MDPPKNFFWNSLAHFGFSNHPTNHPLLRPSTNFPFGNQDQRTTLPQMKDGYDQQRLPRVSIICRTLGRNLLEEAIQSVRRQNFPNLELIVVDAKGDGLESLNDELRKSAAKVVTMSRPLPRAIAANIGLKATRGDLLMFLDDDDWIDPHHIAKLVHQIETHPDVVVAYSDVRKTESDGTPTEDTFSQPFDPLLLLADNFIPIHAALFRRSLLASGCKFDERFKIFEDWDFWIQASQCGQFLHCPGVSAYYRAGGASGSSPSKNETNAIRYQSGHWIARGRSQIFDKWLPFLNGDQFNTLLGKLDRDTDLASLQEAVSTLNKAVHEQSSIAAKENKHANELASKLDASIRKAVKLNQELKLEHQRRNEIQQQLDFLTQNYERALLELSATRNHLSELEDEVKRLRESKDLNLPKGQYSQYKGKNNQPRNTTPHTCRRLETAHTFLRFLRSRLSPKTQPKVQCAVDHAVYCQGHLYLKGWASAKAPLERIDLVTASGLRIPIERTQTRIDVHNKYPGHHDSKQSGFNLFLEIECSEVWLEFFIDSNCIQHWSFTPQNFTSFEELSNQGEFVYLDLNTQYEIYRREEARRDRRRKSLLPTIKQKPLISVIVPVFNVDAKWLDACIQSVISQSYTNWQLVLHDDHSTKGETTDCLLRWKTADQRICVQFGQENQHICGASNSALGIAEGEYIGMLDHDDELHPLALEYTALAIQQHPGGDYFYTDEDKITEEGKHCQPHFKPDWSPTLLESMMYLGHFSVIRRRCIDQVGGFRIGFEGSQDYDLALRISKFSDQFIHIRRILYHWRMVPGSVAGDTDEKRYAYDAAVKALGEHVSEHSEADERIKPEVRRTEFTGLYQVRRRLPVGRQPAVSVIIPFHNAPEMTISCLASVLASSYGNLEVLVISNNSNREAVERVRGYISEEPRARFFEYNHPFNWSSINNYGAKQTSANYLLFINNDMQVIKRDWVERLLDIGSKSGIGATGAKLLFSDHTIQHAGIIIGLGGTAGHAFRFMNSDMPGYFGYAAVAREVSAVTGACMLVDKEAFWGVNGFDERLAVAYNDVDFCLRLREVGFRTAYTPFASLLHFESQTRTHSLENMSKYERRQFQEEASYIQERHYEYFRDGDLMYNPSLTLLLENYSLRIPPLAQAMGQGCVS